MQGDDLKPCPFCGYALTTYEGICEGYVEGSDEEEVEFKGICCPGCAVFLPKQTENGTASDGVEAWNRRAEAALSDAEPVKTAPAVGVSTVSEIVERVENCVLFSTIGEYAGLSDVAAFEAGQDNAVRSIVKSLRETPPTLPAQAVAVPAGWKLVPGEPPPEMIRAMAESKAVDDEGELPSMCDLLDFSGENKRWAVLRAAYAAMLAASPTPPAEKEDGE